MRDVSQGGLGWGTERPLISSWAWDVSLFRCFELGARRPLAVGLVGACRAVPMARQGHGALGPWLASAVAVMSQGEAGAT